MEIKKKIRRNSRSSSLLHRLWQPASLLRLGCCLCMGFIELPALAMEGSDARTRLSMLITALRQIVMLLLAFCVVMALAGRAYESGFGPHADTDSSGTSGGRDAALPGSRRRWAEEGPLIGLAAPRWGGRPAQQWQPAVPLQMRPSKWRRVPHWPPAAPPRPPPLPPKAARVRWGSRMLVFKRPESTPL